jgi:response regulator RpfG family c-di-GMP phosphodiesterase
MKSIQQKEKILIAEDSPTQAEQLRYLLDQLGYKVSVAKNGEEALALLDGYKPALVISDINMPVMNGYELCKHLKENENTHDIPVMLLTSLTNPEDVLEGLACGADSFITKPFSTDYLLAHIQQIITNWKLHINEPVRVGVEVLFGGKRRFISADQQQMLGLLLSTYEAAVQRNTELIQAQEELRSLNEHLEELVEDRTAALTKEIAERKQAEEELITANKELVYQNEEKEKRATELVLANKELAYQNEEKEKRAAELSIVQMETSRRLQHIDALRAIDQAISGSLDLHLTLSIVLEQVVSQLNVDAADVLLLNPHTQMLDYAAGRGFRSKAIERSRLRLGEGHAGHVALERQTVSVHDLLTEKNGSVRADLLAGEEFDCYHGVPLISKGQVKGVLEVFLRSHRTMDDEWLNFLATLAGQVAIAVDSASLFDGLQRSNTELVMAYDATIEGWSAALDLRDKETEGHSQRVTEIALNIARVKGMSEEQLVHVRRGALLHDIGKMGIPDSILLKPGPLTDEEWVIMRQHPQHAFDLLSPIAYLKPALDIPYCHHEKWDGSGYPRGLKGENIPLAACIFAVVDVYDALTSDRPYRKAWTKKKTIEHIKAGAGSHFDPAVVEAFLGLITDGK